MREHETDREIAAQLRAMPIPAASADFENRIIMAAMQEKQIESSVTLHQGKNFNGWWNRLWTHYQPQLAVAASVALVALFILPSYMQTSAQKAEDRYTVNGVGLLADVDLALPDEDESDDGEDIEYIDTLI